MQRRESLKKQTREMPAALKRTLLANDSGLEIIKETDDYNTTPMKVKEPRITIPIENNPEEENHEGSPIQEEAKKETPVKKTIPVKSKLARRKTVALKPPTKLSEELESKKIPKALARLRKEPDTSPGATYVTSGINTKKKSFTNQISKPESMLKKPESRLKKPESRLKAPVSKPSLKTPSKPSALKQPSANPNSPPQKAFKRPTQATSASKETPSKLDEEAKERKRKMMAERKLLLKKKLAAIKIQKFWAARQKRRKLRIEFLKVASAVRRIQRWFRAISSLKKQMQLLLEQVRESHLGEVLRLQRAFRRHRD